MDLIKFAARVGVENGLKGCVAVRTFAFVDRLGDSPGTAILSAIVERNNAVDRSRPRVRVHPAVKMRPKIEEIGIGVDIEKENARDSVRSNGVLVCRRRRTRKLARCVANSPVETRDISLFTLTLLDVRKQPARFADALALSLIAKRLRRSAHTYPLHFHDEPAGRMPHHIVGAGAAAKAGRLPDHLADGTEESADQTFAPSMLVLGSVSEMSSERDLPRAASFCRRRRSE